jgi:hypothetical protein
MVRLLVGFVDEVVPGGVANDTTLRNQGRVYIFLSQLRKVRAAKWGRLLGAPSDAVEPAVQRLLSVEPDLQRGKL